MNDQKIAGTTRIKFINLVC